MSVFAVVRNCLLIDFLSPVADATRLPFKKEGLSLWPRRTHAKRVEDCVIPDHSSFVDDSQCDDEIDRERNNCL